MSLATGRSPTGVLPTNDGSGTIPPLNEQGTPTSGVDRRPLFAKDGSFRSPRSQPSPPAGPPPPRRPPPGMAEALGMKLPGINAQGMNAGLIPGASSFVNPVSSSEENDETFPEEDKTCPKDVKRDKKAGKRIDSMGMHGAQTPPTLSALPESEDIHPGRREFNSLKGASPASPSATEGSNRAEPRLSAEIALAARKAQRVAEVRSIAQEVARVSEHDTNTGNDEKERGEIERALAAVDETRRKRMERQHVEQRGVQQDEEKLRRRQAKREQLMKKRKDMEERLEEEAVKMAELTESAKKKGESKFMSEEAKREAEERIRAEAEVVAQLERQAADMALQRENMQKQLAEREDIKAAEIEANTSALKTKRALVEARMRQEEEEIKTLSEAAKREVEAKMVAEAAAIAEMERQALQLSTKRAELQAEMTNKRELEDTLVQEAQLIARKREAIEAKMQQEEAELQKLSDEAKQRVLEKMAAEAAAIAGMEREASKLAEERAILESQIAEQRSSNAPEGTSAVPTNTKDDIQGQGGHVDPVDTQGIPLTTISGRDEACAPVLTVSENAEETTDVTERAAPQSTSPAMREDQREPGLVDIFTSTSSAESPEVLRYSETIDDGLALAGSVQVDGSEWNGPQAFPQADSIGSSVCAHCRTHQREMSTAHLAAAAGHLTCLEAIQSTQREMLAEVDSSGRSPLFYACANAHADAADLLIQESPQSCHAMDVNRDTPLHAAALAGSRLCCRLLLQHGRSEVEPRNEMEMTPAHLAANNDVLEVLSQHGANLNAKDADLRTPLFVACASDRLEKAEFLCELLEYADQDLGEVDKRGDTPMHAAAYNGSTACLLLLLQYGVEPDARNTKGLRPIDLASRRGQTACEKILMEYQLHHHVNNSYFDSVLFLATLEGHKRCRETLNSVKQQGDATAGVQEDSALVRPQSLMSLRRERSVRLEHWGDWISYEDQNEKSVFWYNHVEEKSQRDAPTGVREGSTSALTKASMRLKREGDWIEYTLPDGNVFYYNDKNNEFQWERPDDLSSTAAVSQEWADEDERLEGDTDIGGSTGDWTAFKDPSTGLVFWYNHVTDESQWEPPGEDREVGDRGVDTESRADGNSMVPEENVREIDSVDDLFTPR